MKRLDPNEALSQLIEHEKERIVRLWAKRVRSEVQDLDLPNPEVRKPLADAIAELARLLKSRGEDALRLWPESIRSHGIIRYDQRFEAEDLAREMKALQHVLLSVYHRRFGRVEPEVADYIAELAGEAGAAMQSSFARVLRTEEVRFKEAALMESILHHVDIGIALAETDGSLVYATPAVGRLLGLPVRALLGGVGTQPLAAALAQIKARHLDGRPFRVADFPYERAIRERAPVPGGWMVVDRPPGGEEVIIEMGAVPIWDESPQGQMVGVVQTMTDRTETAQKTAELSRAYDELRRLQGRLLERTRVQALGQLAGGAAHALNNLLNVLRLRLALMKKESRPEHLEALDQTVQKIGELVARLQEFSVPRAEETLVDAELDPLVTEAVDLARPDFAQQGRNLELVVRLEARSRVRVDPAFLRELVVSLLFAGRDRMSQGGTLTVTTRGYDGWAELEVADTGKPYTLDELARLFDPLRGKFRTPQLSLLLSVGRNQAQKWGGELTCDSQEGRAGATFRLRLPQARAQEQPEETKAPVRPARPPGKGQRRQVLVVDDDLDNARMMCEVLTEEGYAVKAVHSAKDALVLWERQPFDAALLDALMPEISGWELARELRRRSPQALLAMVTGADVRGQSRANLALVDAVFRKPVDVAALDEFLSQPAHAAPGEEPSAHP